MAKIHLVCNAHLDPVWLWEWEEGAAEALSTFRTAADFCEEFDGFIFNHNEAILYQWIEEYDPPLFSRIVRLVKNNRWHIMGGWYLQPDCNMPSAESIIRQILVGRQYFSERFGKEPTTAVNFDSFGHARGLVQILAKTGYDSYVICRPGQKSSPVDEADFLWKGLDGSHIIVHRADENYNSVRGQVANELSTWLETFNHDERMFLWGVGNHGGGPSRKDLTDLERAIHSLAPQHTVLHSVPESYFHTISQRQQSMPRLHESLNPVFTGCYTSQIRVKKLHRQLENAIYSLEKMASCATLNGLSDYPTWELNEAIRDLLEAEFHDSLPGTAIESAEQSTLRILSHGLTITSRLRARSFFALASGQLPVSDGETPILVYNPHPYSIEGVFECEFVLPSQNWNDEFSMPIVRQEDTILPSQAEKEEANFGMDWRKRAVFRAVLKPSSMNRFDCSFHVVPHKPVPSKSVSKGGYLQFSTEALEVAIDTRTGWMGRYQVNGVDMLRDGGFRAVVVDDTSSPWGEYRQYRSEVGEFRLLESNSGTEFSGVTETELQSVRVVEDGDVRCVVEAVFGYRGSKICIWYKLPRQGTEIEVEVRVYWYEKDKMLKLCIPTLFQDGEFIGQTMGGRETLDSTGDEVVAQKWVGLVSHEYDSAITIVNDSIHGFDCKDGEMRLTLLRSPAYSAGNLTQVGVPQDRFTPRIDQGEHRYRFWLSGGRLDSHLKTMDANATWHNEQPFFLSFCPSGRGSVPLPLIEFDDPSVQLIAFKAEHKSHEKQPSRYIVRLMESTGESRIVCVQIPIFSLSQKVTLRPFEIKTLVLDTTDGTLDDGDMIERDLA